MGMDAGVPPAAHLSAQEAADKLMHAAAAAAAATPAGTGLQAPSKDAAYEQLLDEVEGRGSQDGHAAPGGSSDPEPHVVWRTAAYDSQWYGRWAKKGSLSFSSDGSRLALGIVDGIRVFDASTGALLWKVMAPRAFEVIFMPGAVGGWHAQSQSCWEFRRCVVRWHTPGRLAVVG